MKLELRRVARGRERACRATACHRLPRPGSAACCTPSDCTPASRPAVHRPAAAPCRAARSPSPRPTPTRSTAPGAHRPAVLVPLPHAPGEGWAASCRQPCRLFSARQRPDLRAPGCAAWTYGRSDPDVLGVICGRSARWDGHVVLKRVLHPKSKRQRKRSLALLPHQGRRSRIPKALAAVMKRRVMQAAASACGPTRGRATKKLTPRNQTALFPTDGQPTTTSLPHSAQHRHLPFFSRHVEPFVRAQS